MKRFISACLALTILFTVLSGCAEQTKDADKTNKQQKLSIVSTIFPGYDFARAVAGDNAHLTLLLPPGSESHSFEPSPQDMITIQNCDVFIYVGGKSDTWIKGVLKSIDTSNMKIISMMEIVDILEEEIKEGMEHNHHSEHNDNIGKEYDEHVWTSPVNAINITQAISDTLCSLDEANALLFKENTADYISNLNDLDKTFRDIVQNSKRKTVVFGDRFPLRYFADEYGLDYFSAFPGCSAETEASVKTLTFLIDKINEENIPVVFHIELSNEKMADAISQSTGAKKLLFHSCHNLNKYEMEKGVTYLQLMEQNAEYLREALN